MNPSSSSDLQARSVSNNASSGPPVHHQSQSSMTNKNHPNSTPGSGVSSGNKSNPPQQSHENLLFVGNLSFFCEESHLFELFDQYTRVDGVRIVRNPERTRSLMFGFVEVQTPHEAQEMARVLNGTFYMGRRLVVARSGMKAQDTGNTDIMKEGATQIHVAFFSTPSSAAPTDHSPVLPTEAWLRKQFTRYGVVLDCQVKEYSHMPTTQRYEGYGFVVFGSYDEAMHVVQDVHTIDADGISLQCKLGRPAIHSRQQPHQQSHGPSGERSHSHPQGHGGRGEPSGPSGDARQHHPAQALGQHPQLHVPQTPPATAVPISAYPAHAVPNQQGISAAVPPGYYPVPVAAMPMSVAGPAQSPPPGYEYAQSPQYMYYAAAGVPQPGQPYGAPQAWPPGPGHAPNMMPQQAQQQHPQSHQQGPSQYPQYGNSQRPHSNISHQQQQQQQSYHY